MADRFEVWVKAERLYYSALIGYIWYEAPENEKNLNTLIEMINASEAREEELSRFVPAHPASNTAAIGSTNTHKSFS